MYFNQWQHQQFILLSNNILRVGRHKITTHCHQSQHEQRVLVYLASLSELHCILATTVNKCHCM